MTDPDLLRLFVAPLERLAVRYLVTGGIAAIVYGDPRFTRDVDLVLELEAGDVARFVDGFDGEDVYIPPNEVIRAELARPEGGHFNLIHRDTSLRADIYLTGQEPFHDWAMEHRRRIEVEGLSVWLGPPEYVIVRKLEYYRDSGSDRHLRDVAMMLRVSGGQIDASALREWSIRRDVAHLVEKARDFDPR